MMLPSWIWSIAAVKTDTRILRYSAYPVIMSSYYICKVWGIPIRIHITLILFLPLLAVQIGAVMGIESIWWGLIAAAGLFVSVALHELGHSVVALSKGIRVNQILLLPIGGLAQLERMTDNPRDELHIAAAGPLVSMALAFLLWTVVRLFGAPQPGLIIYTFIVLGWMNLMLALFNLLPSFPMDGGRIFRAWLTPRLGRVAATGIAAKIGRFMAIVFGIIGILPPFSLIMIAIAIFIYMAAGAEYRMVLLQERMKRPSAFSFGSFTEPPQEDDHAFSVSPPPYARKKPDVSEWWRSAEKRQRDLFERLFDDWSNG